MQSLQYRELNDVLETGKQKQTSRDTKIRRHSQTEIETESAVNMNTDRSRSGPGFVSWFRVVVSCRGFVSCTCVYQWVIVAVKSPNKINLFYFLIIICVFVSDFQA